VPRYSAKVLPWTHGHGFTCLSLVRIEAGGFVTESFSSYHHRTINARLNLSKIIKPHSSLCRIIKPRSNKEYVPGHVLHSSWLSSTSLTELLQIHHKSNMTVNLTEKIQPWRAHWPPTSDKPLSHGTKHGFAKGDTVIMDGNAVGLTVPKHDTKPLKKDH
jgi:hypothetical protein